MEGGRGDQGLGHRAEGLAAVSDRGVRSAGRGGQGAAPRRARVPARVPPPDLGSSRYCCSLVARPLRGGYGACRARRGGNQHDRQGRDGSRPQRRGGRRTGGACVGRRTGRGAGVARGGVRRVAGPHPARVCGDGDRRALVPLAPTTQLLRKLVLLRAAGESGRRGSG